MYHIYSKAVAFLKRHEIIQTERGKYEKLLIILRNILRSVYTHTHTHTHLYIRASLIAQLIKNPPAMQETLVQFLAQEDPLEKR